MLSMNPIRFSTSSRVYCLSLYTFGIPCREVTSLDVRASASRQVELLVDGRKVLNPRSLGTLDETRRSKSIIKDLSILKPG